MKLKNITLAFGLAWAAANGIEGYRSLKGDNLDPAAVLHRWVLEIHRREVEMLKIDWGNPGFCTEWDRDFDRKSRSCGKRGRLIQRRKLFEPP